MTTLGERQPGLGAMTTHPYEVCPGMVFSSRTPEVLRFAPRVALFIGAHPDDVEIQAGGSLLKFQEDFNCQTYILVVTTGGKGSWESNIDYNEFSELRAQEQRKAAEVLRVSGVYFLGMEEGELMSHHETLRLGLAREIRRLKPDVVVTHDPHHLYDFHPDHKQVAQAATEVAGIMAANYGFFPELTTEGLLPHFVPYLLLFDTDHPNFTVSLNGDQVYKKLESIRSHASQFGNRTDELGRFEEVMRLEGQKIAQPYAESFHLFINH